MDFPVKRNIGKSARFGFMSLLTGGVLFLTGRAGVFGYDFAFYIAAAVSLALGTLLIVRYILTDYLVSVTGREMYNLDLVITIIRNKNRFIACRISISSITEAVIVNRGEKIKRQKPKQRLSYCSEFLPDKYLFIYLRDGEQIVRLKTDYNERLYHFLQKILRDNK